VVGIVEVVAHLWRIRGIMQRVLRQAVERRAAAALLIDYPDFNLRLARRLRRAGIPVYYYISPTVWAWRYKRVALIRRWVSRLFVIFPFEIPIYEKERVTFTYTGHPLLAEVRVSESREEFRRRHGVGAGEILLALLPGSREAEVARLLPEIMGAVRRKRRTSRRRRWPPPAPIPGSWSRSRASTCSTPPTPSSPPAAPPTWRRPCWGFPSSPSTASTA
jgi:lipid-A-disaccharide synthase